MAFVVVAYSEGGLDPGFRAGAAIVLWLVVILGLALGRFPRAAIPRPALVAGLLLAGYAAFTGLSLFWADDLGAAFNEVIRVLVYLGLFVVVVIVSTAGGARPWLVGLGLGIGVVAVIALLDRAAPGLFAAGAEQREKLPLAERDLSFPVGYWNGLGLIMAVGILVYAWLGAEGRSRLSRAAATAAIPLAGYTLALTESRGSAAAALAGAFVLVLFGRSRSLLGATLLVGAGATVLALALAAAAAPDVVRSIVQRPGTEGAAFLAAPLVVAAATGALRYALDRPLGSLRAPRWAGGLAVGLVVIAVLAAAVALDPIRAAERFTEPPQIARGEEDALAVASGSGRFQYWETGVEAFASAPIAGIGAGGFGAWWGEHHTIPQRVIFTHSLFIAALAELGIIGLALIVAFLAVVAVTGVRAWAPWTRGSPGDVADLSARRERVGSAPAVALAVLAAGILSSTIDWMWELPAAFGPMVIASALLTGPALAPPPASRRSRFGFGVGALVVGWLAIVAALLSVFGEDKAGDSAEALERGDLDGAIDSANTAATLTPWSAEPYLLEAAALEGKGDLDAADEAVDEALERDSGDWAVWAVAARIQAKRGDVASALASLAEANRRNPEVVEAPRSTFRGFGFEPEELGRG